MLSELNPEDLWKRYSDSKILQIYGSAGIGKSTLSMHFANFILSAIEGKIFWIDTERKTTHKRLQEILGNNSNSIFISQPKILLEQQKIIKSITNACVPVTALVIDTISRHFRSLDSQNTWRKYSENVHMFYENHVLPLLSFQQKTNCFLILVHQITSIPDEGDKPFQYRLFEKIKSEWIYLG